MSYFNASSQVSNLAYSSSISNSYYSNITSGPGSTTAYINANSINTKPVINRDWSKKGPGFNNVNGNTVYFGNICTTSTPFRSFA